MEYKKLSKIEIKNIYNTLMINDFPQDEIRPWHNIELLFNNGCYEGCGFYNAENKLTAYALFVVNSTDNTMLLDYFAVDKNLRGCGIGGKALAIIKNAYTDKHCILLESEHPDYAKSVADKALRERRIAFYTKNGVAKSKVSSHVVDVDYAIMHIDLAENMSDKAVYSALADLYNIMLAGLEKFKSQIKITLK